MDYDARRPEFLFWGALMTYLPGKGRTCIVASLRGPIKVLVMSLFLASVCYAQIPQASDTTSTPVPDAGHDYMHNPLVTVNPSNGSLSVRIPVRMPEGRELTLKYGLAYDSNGQDYLGQPNGGGPDWAGTGSPLSVGGWSGTGPMLTVGQFSYTVDAGIGTQSCAASTGYIFQDSSGDRHNLDLSVVGYTGKYLGANCQTGYSNYTTGGLQPILATTTAIPPNGHFDIPAVTVMDGNGTVYTFPFQTGSGTWMASQVMDRNGNYVTISGGTRLMTPFSYLDTAGRTVISDSGFGSSPETLTVAGLSSPYKITWTTLPNTSFHSSFTYPNPSVPESCPGTSDPAGPTVISSIQLPNGKSFTFSYDTTYGLLNKVTYPTGGYVRYVWGMNTQSEIGFYIWNNNTLECNPRYDAPAITDAYL